MPAERRIDPADGNSYTYKQIERFYNGVYTAGAINDYWKKQMKSARPAANSKAPQQTARLPADLRRAKSKTADSALDVFNTREDSVPRAAAKAKAKSGAGGSRAGGSKNAQGERKAGRFVVKSIGPPTSQAGRQTCQGDIGSELQYKFLRNGDLGKGSFGSVRKAIVIRGLRQSQFVAVKTIKVSCGKHASCQDGEDKVTVQKEIDVLKECDHKNIVNFIDSFVTEHNLYIVTELMEQSLKVLLDIVGEKHFGAERISQKFTFQMLRGLEYLHGKPEPVIHRDLKCANLLVSRNGKVKLADFGLAQVMRGFRKKEICGTPYFIAPEVVRAGDATVKSDVWSVGCTVYEMATTLPPWMADLNTKQWEAKIRSLAPDEHPQLPEGATPQLRNFLLRCFKSDPDHRPLASQLLHDPWVFEYETVACTFQGVEPAEPSPPEFVRSGSHTLAVEQARPRPRYAVIDPSESPGFTDVVAMLPCTDCTVRNKDPKFTEVKAFENKDRALDGVNICGILTGTKVTLLGRYRNEPEFEEEYATIVVDLDQVDFSQAGGDLARGVVAQNQRRVVVKFKHLEVVPTEGLCIVRNKDPKFSQVKAFLCKEHAQSGVNICALPKNAKVTLVGEWRDEPDEYATLRIDLDQADYSETGNEGAKQQVAQRGGKVVVKFKHLTRISNLEPEAALAPGRFVSIQAER